MDMNPMDGKKDPMFKCPECGAMLSVESKEESDSEHENLKPKSKMNAASMPMSDLKSKIAPTTNPPGITNPNLSSF